MDGKNWTETHASSTGGQSTEEGGSGRKKAGGKCQLVAYSETEKTCLWVTDLGQKNSLLRIDHSRDPSDLI